MDCYVNRTALTKLRYFQQEDNMPIYEAITKQNLTEYRDVIMADMYALLYTDSREPGAAGFICIGARDERSRRVLGAVVASVETDEDGPSIYIRSVFVRRDDRRKGIGRELLGRVLTVASGTFIYPEGETSALITYKSVSMLEEMETEIYCAFLRSFGFTDFVEQNRYFRLSEWELMSLDILRPSYKPNKNARSFAEADETLISEINDLTGRIMDPELSFAYVKDENILGMVITEEISPGHYWIVAAEHDGSLTDVQMMSLLRTTAAAIDARTPVFTVTVQPGDDIIREVLMECPGAVVITPRLAWCDIELTRPK